MATLLHGAPVVQALSRQIGRDVSMLKLRGIVPTLGIVRVGDRSSDLAYERGACKRAEQLGVQVKKIILPSNVTEKRLLEALEQVNNDDTIHGCLVFRPLPSHLNTQKVSQILKPEKDIDAITSASMGSLLSNGEHGFAPCTAAACLKLLHYYQIPLHGRKLAVIGKSTAVGLPTALLMMNEEATVSVCHIFTDPEDTRHICRESDVIISAAGCAGLIRANYVRPGQAIIDVGINIGHDGKLCGDVAFDEVEPVVEAITPVPGGVGAVTSTVLINHVVEAAMRASAAPVD